MVTTDERHVDELLESLGPKEWVLAEMMGLREDFDAFYRYRDELLEEHRGDWAAVYHGELICVMYGPKQIYAELERRGIPIWRAVMHVIAPNGSINPFAQHMIRGRLIEDRPNIRAEVVIPAEDASGRVRTHTAFMDFQVDTGSDVTTIARADFESALGISLDQAPRGLQSVGIGDAVVSRAIWGYVFF